MLNLRKANINDSKDIWKWRNNYVTRKNFINQKIISWNEHSAWFKNNLKNKDIITIIAINNNKEKIGVIRYDKISKFEYDISININPKFRNRKLGSEFLLKSEKFLKKNTVILSRIKSKNLPSINLFLKCNYKKIGVDKGIFFLKKIIDIKNLDINKEIEVNKALKIINEIQRIRSKNNVNWMDILRLSFDQSPQDAKKIFSRIVLDDNSISKLSKKLIS